MYVTHPTVAALIIIAAIVILKYALFFSIFPVSMFSSKKSIEAKNLNKLKYVQFKDRPQIIFLIEWKQKRIIYIKKFFCLLNKSTEKHSFSVYFISIEATPNAGYSDFIEWIFSVNVQPYFAFGEFT